MKQKQGTRTDQNPELASCRNQQDASQHPSRVEGPRMPGPRPKRGVPEGLWLKCNGCGSTIYRKEAEQMLNVCPQCGFHWYVSAKQRIEQLFDPGTFEEWDGGLLPTDPLSFSDKKPYAKRIISEQKRTGLSEAALTGTGMIRARRVACGVTDSSFIMGSMGSVVGERLARLVERATTESLPLIIISASGGGLECMKEYCLSCRWQRFQLHLLVTQSLGGCSFQYLPTQQWEVSPPVLHHWGISYLLSQEH